MLKNLISFPNGAQVSVILSVLLLQEVGLADREQVLAGEPSEGVLQIVKLHLSSG